MIMMRVSVGILELSATLGRVHEFGIHVLLFISIAPDEEAWYIWSRVQGERLMAPSPFPLIGEVLADSTFNFNNSPFVFFSSCLSRHSTSVLSLALLRASRLAWPSHAAFALPNESWTTPFPYHSPSFDEYLLTQMLL
jgi:hypothetical protein